MPAYAGDGDDSTTLPVAPALTRSEVVLIGPHRAGKSTIAGLLSERLGVPICSLDNIKWDYFARYGFDREAGRRVQDAKGFHALTLHLKLYSIQMVEDVLSEHRDCIFDFGAGHSMYEDPDHVARVHAALAPFRNVTLLMPTPNKDQSVLILQHRAGPWTPDAGAYFEFERYEVEHPSNYSLAKHRIYTEDQSPTGACDALLQRLE